MIGIRITRDDGGVRELGDESGDRARGKQVVVRQYPGTSPARARIPVFESPRLALSREREKTEAFGRMASRVLSSMLSVSSVEPASMQRPARGPDSPARERCPLLPCKSRRLWVARLLDTDGASARSSPPGGGHSRQPRRRSCCALSCGAAAETVRPSASRAAPGTSRSYA